MPVVDIMLLLILLNAKCFIVTIRENGLETFNSIKSVSSDQCFDNEFSSGEDSCRMFFRLRVGARELSKKCAGRNDVVHSVLGVVNVLDRQTIREYDVSFERGEEGMVRISGAEGFVALLG